MRILDSHLHLWDSAALRYTWLSGRLIGPFGPSQRRAATEEAGDAERAAIFVQAECVPDDALAEVDWVTALAPEAGVVGIVARVEMERGAAVRPHLLALRSRPLVVGVRRLIQDEQPGFATSPAFLAAARAVAEAGYVFDACVRSAQLGEVIVLADAVPDLPLVLDHLGKPDVSGAPGADWLAALSALAERPQVSCKLSGLPAEVDGEWMPEQLTPFLDAALAAFGPRRLLFGADWPVSWPYARWERAVIDWARERVAPHEVDDILWGNAARVYGVV